MYKVYIIIVLVVLTLMYLNSNSSSSNPSVNEPFAETTTSVSYTDADKNKILQVLKDNYEIDALINISQIAKGLQTDGYTVPGKLKSSGDLDVGGKLNVSGDVNITGNLKVGNNITISKEGNITIDMSDNIESGKIYIKNNEGTSAIKKWANGLEITPNNDWADIIRIEPGNTILRTKGDESSLRLETGAGKKSFNASIIKKPTSNNIMFYPNSGDGNNRLEMNNNSLLTDNINNLNGGKLLMGTGTDEIRLCNGTGDCNRYLYIKNNDKDVAGFYAISGDKYPSFNVHSLGRGEVTLFNGVDPGLRLHEFKLQKRDNRLNIYRDDKTKTSWS